MGRPLNKKYFGANANNNLRVRFYNGTASVDGSILRQRSSKKFICVDAAGTQATCVLTATDDANIAAGKMSITVKNDAGTNLFVTKISSHKITASDGSTYPWNFDTSTSDGAVQVEEAGTNSSFAGNVDLT